MSVTSTKTLFVWNVWKRNLITEWYRDMRAMQNKKQNTNWCQPPAESFSFFLHVSLKPRFLHFSSNVLLKQSESEAVSCFVPLWLKHYLWGFSTLFLKRSDILCQPVPLPTGKLKMPLSPQAIRFICLHTCRVRRSSDSSSFCEKACT